MANRPIDNAERKKTQQHNNERSLPFVAEKIPQHNGLVVLQREAQQQQKQQGAQ